MRKHFRAIMTPLKLSLDRGYQVNRSDLPVTTAENTNRWYNCYTAMRFEFDKEKSRKVKRKHGVSLKEAQEIFDQAYIIDQNSDDPEQFRAIGWCGGRLCSVIYEVRNDAQGEYYHLITAWAATTQEQQSYAEHV